MKRKGFTLIELLAVIVILVVIMAVTIPVILNVIETSRREAFKDSVLSAFNEVEYYVLENKLGDVPAEGIEVKNLNLNKNPFQYGIIIKNEDGNLSAEEVSDGEYCAVGTINNLSITKGECDTASPTGEVTVEGKKATITLRDDQGVMGYEITKSEEVSSWTTIEVTKEIVVEYEVSESGTYYVHIKDKFGKTSRISFVIDESAFGSHVTYIVNGTTYEEIINVGSSVLTPQSFTPTKTGATFLGWSDSLDNTTVLTSKNSDGSPMTLYAVFKYNDATPTLSVSYANAGNSTTYYSGIDMSKYSAATVGVSANAKVYFRGGYWNIDIRSGGASIRILSPSCDWQTPQVCTASSFNKTVTLNFTSSSGATSLSTVTTSSGTSGEGGIWLSNFKLIGRTVVG